MTNIGLVRTLSMKPASFKDVLVFRGRLYLREEGVEGFSNISGIHQIRFAKGNIKETYGDVLATIKREFEDR